MVALGRSILTRLDWSAFHCPQFAIGMSIDNESNAEKYETEHRPCREAVAFALQDNQRDFTLRRNTPVLVVSCAAIQDR